MNDEKCTNSLDELEAKLKYSFKNQELLDQALTHRSVSSGKDYERFEFLGDAVLDLVIAHLLFCLLYTSPSPRDRG